MPDDNGTRVRLGDICHNFMVDLEPVANALLADVERYAEQGTGSGREVQALRDAARTVVENRTGPEGCVRLVTLAFAVLRFHDAPPGSEDLAARERTMYGVVDRLAQTPAGGIPNA